jgi:ATP-dependent helicase HrpA
VAGDLERTGLRDWPVDAPELPRSVERSLGGHTVQGFPAFVDESGAVAIRVLPTVLEQRAAMHTGQRRLLRLAVASPVKAVERALTARARLVLGSNPDGSLAALIEDAADAAVDALAPEPVWTHAEFTALRERVAAGLISDTHDIVALAQRVLAAAHEVRLALPGAPPPAQADAIADIRAQFARLLPPGFLTSTGRARLPDLARYITAIGRRLDRLPRDVDIDRARMARVRVVQDAYEALRRALPAGRAAAEDVVAIGWQVEELRVSLWAQQLGTPRPVSEQRIFRAIDAIRL